MDTIFNITEKEAAEIFPIMVLATNAMDVLVEALTKKELVTCPKEPRWIMI